jgi:hypothetical protein
MAGFQLAAPSDRGDLPHGGKFYLIRIAVAPVDTRRKTVVYWVERQSVGRAELCATGIDLTMPSSGASRMVQRAVVGHITISNHYVEIWGVFNPR